MKKVLPLLFLIFTAVSTFAQTELVRWNGANLQPAPFISSNAIEASNIGGNNISFSTTNWGNPNCFLTSNWTPSTTPDYTKYIQLHIKTKANFSANLTNLQFRYIVGDGGPRNFEIRYSKNSSFPSNGTLLSTNSIPGNEILTTFNQSLTGIALGSNENLYIRIYAFNNSNIHWNGGTFRLEHGYNDSSPATNYSVGPVITGTTATACTPINPSPDFGNNTWVGKVYSYTGNTPAITNYLGYVTEPEIFDRNVGEGAVSGATTQLCSAPVDRFMTVYKMRKNFELAGTYKFNVGGDDGYRLKIDGVTVIDRWQDQGYVETSVDRTLTAGNHDFVLEYYEKAGSSRVSFSHNYCNAPGNSTVFGNNTWNVYAFNNSTLDAIQNYRGYYTQTALNVDTETAWNRDLSPSSAYTWQGCDVARDNFVTIHKRKGFPCGKYQIIADKWDDQLRIKVNNNQVYEALTYNPGPNANIVIGTFALNENATVEIITAEQGGVAHTGIRFVPVEAVYSNSAWNISPENAAVVINGPYTFADNIEICSCKINSGEVKIAAGKTVTIREGLNVNPSSTFVVENNASLVQINDNATNSGKIIFKRNTTPITRFDFTYWSSPVAAADWKLNQLSPNTLRDKFYSYNPTANGWVTHLDGNQEMITGKGYIVRAPQSFSTTVSAVFETKFIGAPNNGVKTLAVTVSPSDKSNLVGNPYPSALSADLFYEANKNVIKGTFYFWTHATPVSSTADANGTYQYSASNYISYNATGSTSNGDVTNCSTCSGTKPTGNIAAGQSFFVDTKINGTLTFNNSMRVKTANSNGNFYRTGNTTQNDSTAVEKHRIWVNLKNAAGAYNEMLVGYVEGATNDTDEAFDGETYASGTAIYSLLNNQNLVIQGRALPFSNEDIVPIGYTSAAGEFSIGLESFDGLFAGQDVFLFDKNSQTYHNLKEGRYTFTTTSGTHNNRFEIRYRNASLGVDLPSIQPNDVVVYNSGSQIGVKTNQLNIKSVQVFDLLGKSLANATNVNQTSYITTGLNAKNQVVLVTIILEEGQKISKKVLLQ
ncbi:T9SS sorting signal type C domain-containing protein [Flavobacterium sp. NST-5]|uniref:T9SS sorting signal type C domain-containing protein n=1 Tax=Flavobacterium ichthyis TaxID=2698827 RepID=A0ABW9ZB22_9FLAO|nr:T9SS sorting signal type C domain-containing protein [Flavobacterium ichthyis]NBL64969.1 T9SS sorting signal type C domain-containing protein [Flavobacterium ichthyis]